MSFTLHSSAVGFQIREGDSIICEVDDEDDARRLLAVSDPANDEQHLLMILAEECSELAKEALKAARFGMDRIEPGQTLSNYDRIVTELSDVLAVAEMLNLKHRPYRIGEKQHKVREAMKLSASLGRL